MQRIIHAYYKRMINPNVNLDLDVNVPLFLLKSAYYHLRGRNIIAHHNTTIQGLKNISINGRLLVGINNVGFLGDHDKTFLRINGTLQVNGTSSIGKGCRVFVGEHATCVLEKCSLTGLSNIIATHSIKIGEGSAISWGCELLDRDYHQIKYEGKIDKCPGIVIGKHVWLGSHVKILKGVHIGDNSVIAANAVVTKPFPDKNVLIAGNPARIIRHDVSWS